MDVSRIPEVRAVRGRDRGSRVLLISPPWRLLNWPSLAVGVLKAYLAKHQIPADGLHLHFDVALRFGVQRYELISAGWELGEALFFALSWPDDADSILDRTAAELERKNQSALARMATRECLGDLEQAMLSGLDGVDLSKYHLAGISAGALQLGGTVYTAKILRQRRRDLRIVAGGGSVLGSSGAALLRKVPWIDAIVDGEGEEALAALASEPVWDDAALQRVPNLHYRSTSSASVGRTQSRVLSSLDDVPPPDMDEFYASAREAGYPSAQLTLPLEASRGCAWEHRMNDGHLHGCTFCGLYRNSPNFREKRLETVMAEIRSGVARNQALELSFVDAYLPPSYTKELLRCIADSGLDVTLFCEMRCDLDAETASLLSRAGARHVQLGVEAFHTRILAGMAKGTRMIDNVSSIKLCEEFGVPYQYNLMTHLPGVHALEIRESTRLLPLLFGFKPPSVAEFYLDRGSRIYADPARFGVLPQTVDASPFAFLPSSMGSTVCQVVPADLDSTDEVKTEWNTLESLIESWRALHEEARGRGITQLLTFRDTGRTLVVTDHRAGDPIILELNGVLRCVLLACNRLMRRRDLEDRFSALDQILGELRKHRLIVEESGLVLGLPARSRLPNGAPRVGE